MSTPAEIDAALETFAVAIKEKLVTEHVLVNKELEFGKRYFLDGDLSVVLPSVVGRTEDSTIHLSKASGVAVTITVNPANVDARIRVRTEEDTVVVFDVDRPLSIHYDASAGNWLI